MKFNIVNNLYAQAVSGKTNQVQSTTKPADSNVVKKKEEGTKSGMSTLLLPLLLIVVFYFFLIRPQQKREKKKKAMLSQIKKNDKVVTRGGIWGVVASVDVEKGIAIVKIAKGINIDISISAIEVVNPQAQADKKANTKK